MGTLHYREVGTYLYKETENAEIRPCRQYQVGIESKPLRDLYLDVEKFTEKRKNIIYVDLRDAYSDLGMPGFNNVQDKDIIIGLNPTMATEWCLAHEFVHVLVEHKFYCRIDAKDNKVLKEKYELMYNIVLDIH